MSAKKPKSFSPTNSRASYARDIHDHLFRTVFGTVDGATQIIRAATSPEEIEDIDLSKMRKESFPRLDAALKRQFTDLIFTAPMLKPASGTALLLVFYTEEVDHLRTTEFIRMIASTWLIQNFDNESAEPLAKIVPVLIDNTAARARTKA